MNIFTRIFYAVKRRYDRFVLIPLSHRQFQDIHILSSLDSIRYIIDHRCSVSRYGDGEIIMNFGGGLFWLPRSRRFVGDALASGADGR